MVSCAPVTTVLDEMVSRHIGSAVVTDSGHPVGIFTALDACRHLSVILRDLSRDRG